MDIDGNWIPIVAMVAFFWTLVAVTRAIADWRVRSRLIDAGATPDMVKVLTSRPPQTSDHAGSLKWGIVLTTTALAVILIGSLNLEGETAGIGLAMLGAGIGLLIFYPIGVRVRERERTSEADRAAERAQVPVVMGDR